MIAQVGQRQHERATDQLTDQVSVGIEEVDEVLVVLHHDDVDIEAA